jgi:hypothetical protein
MNTARESLDRVRLTMYRRLAAYRYYVHRIASQPWKEKYGRSTNLHHILKLIVGDFFERFPIAGSDSKVDHNTLSDAECLWSSR